MIIFSDEDTSEQTSDSIRQGDQHISEDTDDEHLTEDNQHGSEDTHLTTDCQQRSNEQGTQLDHEMDHASNGIAGDSNQQCSSKYTLISTATVRA